MEEKPIEHKTERPYGVASSPEHLPPLIVSQQQVEQAHEKVFGTEDEFRVVPWSTLFDRFYQERIVYVPSNETLLVRFRYDYEIDLERINSEADLLCWALHLCGKTWMNTERLAH